MTPRDENDLTDEELLEMWEQGEPVEVAHPDEAPGPTKRAEESPSIPARREAPAERRDT